MLPTHASNTTVININSGMIAVQTVPPEALTSRQ